MIAAPLEFPAVKLIVTSPSPGEADNPVGASGIETTGAGVTDTALDAGLCPSELIALSLIE